MHYVTDNYFICGCGGTGRRAGLSLLWILLPCGFKSHRPHQHCEFMLSVYGFAVFFAFDC